MISRDSIKADMVARVYWSIGGLFLILMACVVYIDQWYLMLLPFGLITAAGVLLNVRFFFLLLFFMIPLSDEYMLTPSIGTDMPTELLMILIGGIVLWYMLSRIERTPGSFFVHPISLVLWTWISWMILTSLTAEIKVVAVKFVAAKFWYILSFFVGPLYFIRHLDVLKRALNLILVPLVVLVGIMLIRYSFLGFAFEDVEKVLGPTFRNHVAFASIIVCFLPFAYYLYRTSSKNKLWYKVALLVLMSGLILSYTRAAYLSLLAMGGMYLIVRGKLMKPAVTAGLMIPVVVILYLIPNNKYLEYAPDYNKTVTHYSFDELMDATTKGTDLSSMERIYRWVAASYMIRDRPWIGFGPGSFYFHYKPYTVKSFRTYVSDNKDRTGIHSYYLMTWVEQGTVGILIFLALIALFFVLAGQIYHQTEDADLRTLVMACILSFTSITVLQTLNDLIETDKVGPFFYLSLSLVIMVGLGLISRGSKTSFTDSEGSPE